ncbi:hypothetical protein VIGAN_06238100 [Vigna angularis var. angularis]|uniref:Uncharacterized protein n=1 Tax=Vigna angularis var. angularis TaxID=157739 RepID=A0A0S3SDY7_PHAAN|nr:hypothetical protein VIGAN_06238100 [Vigna angularis var. angularis]
MIVLIAKVGLIFIPGPWSKSDFLRIVRYGIGIFRLLLGYGSSVPMSSRTGKGPAVRSYRRRKAVLDLDLNLVPASDNREHEGPSTQSGPLGVIVEQQPPASQPTMIDVEDIDDDVVECTPGAFAEAKNKSRRIRGRTIVDVELEDQTRRNKRRRELRNQTIINCEKVIVLKCFLNLELSLFSTVQYVWVLWQKKCRQGVVIFFARIASRLL